MLLAIGLQESRFEHREQIGGPARGFWQFEAGGVRGVLTHPASRDYAQAVCETRHVAPMAPTVLRRLAVDDLLACAFARLLLYTDPRALPAVGKGGEAWAYYLRNWRPGKPRARSWNGFYAQAVEAVRG